jgi:hypothetical protein
MAKIGTVSVRMNLLIASIQTLMVFLRTNTWTSAAGLGLQMPELSSKMDGAVALATSKTRVHASGFRLCAG